MRRAEPATLVYRDVDLGIIDLILFLAILALLLIATHLTWPHWGWDKNRRRRDRREER